MTALEELGQTFTGAHLVVPPIPDSLRPALERRGEWFFSTRDVDRMDTYFLAPFVQEALSTSTADYVVVTHEGHGVNSYSLNYLLALSPLVVLTQIAWGGVYANAEAQAAKWANEMAAIELLIQAGSAVSADDIGGRLVIARSDFLPIAVCQVVGPGEVGDVEALERPIRDDPLGMGLELLTSRHSS